jgi:sugar lactone lactonase YvrE
MVTGGGISTFAGNGDAGFAGDGGAATSARLNYPYGVFVDSSTNIYIADSNNNCIRKVMASGIITKVAGCGVAGYGGDGGPAAAAYLSFPTGVALDSLGNLYIADAYNHRVREVSPSGTITTVAGNGTVGFGGDGGAATSARLRYPWGVAVDASGNLYIADAGNYRVRKVSGGTITTVAGSGSLGSAGDGGLATTAQLSLPLRVALDSSGTIYIALFLGNSIRKVSGGIISTVVGSGAPGYSGDGGPAITAKLNAPSDVALDDAGNLFIADSSNQRVRKVSGGIITTVAGNGTAGYSGDGGPATSAELNFPTSIALDVASHLYISDGGNSCVRMVP